MAIKFPKLFVDQTKTKVKHPTKNTAKRAVSSNVTSIYVNYVAVNGSFSSVL